MRPKASNVFTAFITPLFSLCLIVGCNGGTDETPKEGTEEKVQMRRVESTPDMVAQGKAAFGACQGCHGEKAEGRVGIGPRLASATFLAAASDDFLAHNIKEGRPGTTMIPWGTNYSDAQIDAIIAYLRSLEPVAPAELNEGDLAGDAAKGASDFRLICSGCHGRNGGGYQETANGTGIGRKAFLDKASNGFLRHIIHEGKSHTAMRGFATKDPTAVANLEDADIENIITYLRKNAW